MIKFSLDVPSDPARPQLYVLRSDEEELLYQPDLDRDRSVRLTETEAYLVAPGLYDLLDWDLVYSELAGLSLDHEAAASHSLHHPSLLVYLARHQLGDHDLPLEDWILAEGVLLLGNVETPDSVRDCDHRDLGLNGVGQPRLDDSLPGSEHSTCSNGLASHSG